MSKDFIYLIGVPKSFKKDIQQNIVSTIKNVRRNLRYIKPISVAVFEASSGMVISEIGMAGSAIGKSGIEIRIDFKRKFAKQKFAAELSSSVCHEATHLIREDAVGYNFSLLDAMINEGVACYVERAFLPKRRIPYISPIKNENKFIKKAASIFSKRNYNHSEWFFGSKIFPKWVGYRLGYLMVDGYAKNNKIALSDLVRMKSRDILRGSKVI